MGGAANQKELIVAQRKLARYQRLAEEKGALAGKVVKAVPEWIVEDAKKQAEWVAEKKKEKAERDAAGSGGSVADKTADQSTSAPSSSSPDAAMVPELLQVECLSCGVLSPWTDLELGDGYCAACLVAAADTAGSLEDIPSNTAVDALADAPTAGSVEEAPEGVDTANAPQRSTWRSRRAQRARQDDTGE